MVAQRLVVATVLLSIVPATALAQQPSSAQDDAAFQAATRRFNEGVRLFEEGKKLHDQSKIESAYLEFKAAYALYPSTIAGLSNLIESELATSRNVDAMKHLRTYVRENGTPPENSPTHKVFVEQWSAAFAATGHIEIDAPSNYHIVLDGKDDAGISPLKEPIDVSPGHHVVDGQGAAQLHAEIDAPAGTLVKAKLSPPPSKVEPRPAVQSSGHDTPSVPQEPPFWTPSRTWGTVIAGVGVASLATGAIFAAKNQSDADDAASLSAQLGPSACYGGGGPAQCQDLKSARDSQSQDQTLSVLFLGVGVAATVVGGILFFLPHDSASTTAVVPMAAPHTAGIQLTGGF